MFFFLLFIPLYLHSFFSSASRETVAPFISGDSFRSCCDIIYDETCQSVDLNAITPKSMVFLNGDMLGRFLETIHPLIEHNYILVVHNSDHSVPGIHRNYLNDPKILALFTSNPDGTDHYKLHPLPIGIENRHWNSHNFEILQKVQCENLEKKYWLYCNFNRHTFPTERSEVLDRFSRMPFVYASTKKPYLEYVRDLAMSRFVLSPRGNGLDCFRTWEALYAGSYPIVKSSSLDSLFESLPVVIVQDWSEVTLPFLQKKYKELKNTAYFDWNKIYINYYLHQIETVKNTNREEKEFYPSGQLKCHFLLQQGILEGSVLSYYEDGTLLSEIPYYQGYKEGLAKYYRPSGKLFATEQYSKGRKNGLARYYSPQGTLFLCTSYINGLRKGQETTYYENGDISDISFYVQDKLNGIYRSWSSDGILLFEAEYQDGIRHGKFLKYYENGAPYLEMEFYQGKLNGEKKRYDKEGNFTISYYEGGKLVE